MKQVYIKITESKFYLNTDDVLINNTKGRKYYYDEIPSNKFEEYSGEDVWEKFLKAAHYESGFKGHKTRFKKRIYADGYPIINEYIFKDELLKFTIETIYEIVENPSIKDLQDDLGFMGYSELVFNREQELRKLMEV